MNASLTLLPSAQYDTTPQGTSADFPNRDWTGGHFILDMTIVGGASVTLGIQGKDPLSGKYYTILTSAAITTNVVTVLKIGPELTASANLVARDVLPSVFRVVVTNVLENSATFSVGMHGV